MKTFTAQVAFWVVTPPVSEGLLFAQQGSSLRGASHGGVTTTLPTEDGVCIDVKGWQDARGYDCNYYKSEKYCTAQGEPGPGWWATWGTLGAYASAGRSSLDACCACGGGITTCCKTYTEFEAEQAHVIEQVKKYAVPLNVKARVYVEKAGQAAEQQFSENWTNRTVDAGKAYQNASAQLRNEELNNTRAIFANLTQHRDELKDATKYQLTLASSEATWRAFDETIHSDKQQALASEALQAFQHSDAAWDFTKSNISAMAKRSWSALSEFYASHGESMHRLVDTTAAVNKFADDSQKAGEGVRWGRQASLLAAELTDLAGNRTEIVDGLVHQAEGRTARALQLTSANSGVLDELEGMVSASEEDSDLASQIASPA